LHNRRRSLNRGLRLLGMSCLTSRKKPKAILFDLDGTLWDRTSAVRALAGAQHQHLARVVGHIPRAHYVERIVALDDLGRLDKRVLYETVGVEFDLSDADVACLHGDFWARFPAHTQPFSEVIQTLKALRRVGIRLGIITNGWIAVQEAKIEQLGLSALIDAVLISEREGVRKPNPEIFHRALSKHRKRGLSGTTRMTMSQALSGQGCGRSGAMVRTGLDQQRNARRFERLTNCCRYCFQSRERRGGVQSQQDT
jgi:putative hydrolase of the HAD superfamily